MTRIAISMAAVFAAAAHGQSLMSADDVLGRIEVAAPAPGNAAQASPGAMVMARVKQYRATVGTLAPADAAARWFDLYDQAARLDPASTASDYDSYDLETSRPVGRDSLLSSLPPPAVWPALRGLAARRQQQAPGDREAAALKFLTEMLTGDRTAADATLAMLDKRIADLGPDERERARYAVTAARSDLVALYGSPQDVARSFELRLAGSTPTYEDLAVPDLVALVGADEARRLLTAAVSAPVFLGDVSGDETRKLAREVALENVARMQVAQWQLATNIEAARLYEAMERRFDPAASQGSAPQANPDIDDFRKRQASAWYFLSSVIEGRQADAERTLAFLAGDSDVYLPSEAVDALRKAGQDQPLYRFLGAQLERRPQTRAWDVYIREGAFLGRSAETLALIDKVLARKGLPEFLVADLHIRRIGALLAADKVDAAAQGYRALLAKPPVRAEAALGARFDAALGAAMVGRLVGRRDLVDLGLTFAPLAAAEMVGTGNPRVADYRGPKLWRELRKNGRAASVQPLAIAILQRAGNRSGFQALGGSITSDELQALVELAGIWSERGRHADVLGLVAGSGRWGVVDAGPLLSVRDSVDLPFGVALARALRATGDTAAALRVARATISQMPGRDAPYELLVELDPDAPATLDVLASRDPFEERPLIWKATVLMGRGENDAAEATIRRAISIDPSDGEEGPNDRMRAYAVLAELLKRKGDAAAGTYAKAVTAIRMSEHADQLHEAGLYERAFAEYRQALEQFSDAYCIQSRLAVQLSKQGRRAEALDHYRRAYELMPDSFGRVESHCFGCESVFQGAEAQSIAERVFEDAIRKTPGKAQSYYLLAYLREQQGRAADSLAPLRRAVSIDPQYLNAWMHLQKASEHTYVEPWELDIARLKLLELDPRQLHVTYSLDRVGDLAALWRGAERAVAASSAAEPVRQDVYPFRATAASQAKARESLPPEMVQQLAFFEAMQVRRTASGAASPPGQVLRRHVLLARTVALMGVNDVMDEY